MHAKTKDFELDGEKYQTRWLTPEMGSYIWQRIVSACCKAGRDLGADTAAPVVEEAPDAPKPTVEDRVRAMCGLGFMHISYEDTRFIHSACMRVLSKFDAQGMPMPVMHDSGKWAAGAEDVLAHDPGLVDRLKIEILAFNLASFLAERRA